MNQTRLITVRDAAGADDVAVIRTLFQEYQTAIGVDLCFQGFEAELRGLPGAYAPPRGGLFLAEIDGETAGCVALRPFADNAGEMKRLYVRAAYRSFGLGRRLTERVIETARSAGYKFLYLDTLPTMVGAQRLYETLGFVDVAPYVENPAPGTRFMRLQLSESMSLKS